MSALDAWIFIAELAGLLICIFILLGMLATFVGKCIKYGTSEQAATSNDGEDAKATKGTGI